MCRKRRNRTTKEAAIVVGEEGNRMEVHCTCRRKSRSAENEAEMVC